MSAACSIILCRNVLIYFNEQLQARVHELIYDSLVKFGILGLGQQEFLKFSPRENCYETISEDNKLYKKMR
ncbi:MAG: CheR family methyltransferase [Planctomycetota bacterium]